MRLTWREAVCLLILVGITTLIVLLFLRREGGPATPSHGPTAPVSSANPAVSSPDNGPVTGSTNSADGADDFAGAEEAPVADDPDFAEKVRRIRPPPTGAAASPDLSRAAERRKARQAESAALPGTNELVRILDQIASQPWTFQSSKLFQDTLLKWSNKDPAAALEYALSIDSRRTRLATLNNLIANWARTDAKGAYAWAVTHLQEDAGAMDSALRPIFGALAGENLGSALQSVFDLPAGSGRSTALRAVVERAARDGSAGEMAAYLTTITDPQEARLFASSLAQNWAIQDAPAAAEWAMSLGDPQMRNAALGSVVGSWTSDQPEQAAEWVSQLPAGTLRNQQLTKLTQTWAGFDPVGAADWLIEQQPPQPSLDPAIQGLVTTVMRSNPEGAMAWAGAIANPRIRDATLRQVGKNWLRQNPQQATSYILTAPLPPDVKARLLQGK
jgi:hypothetical protein